MRSNNPQSRTRSRRPSRDGSESRHGDEGKPKKRRNARSTLPGSNWKKAIVTLAAGDKISCSRV